VIFTQQLEDWSRGLHGEEADRAILALGIDFAGVGAARANWAMGLHPPVVRWELTEADFPHRVTGNPRQMASLVSEGVPIRLAVTTDAALRAIIPQLFRVGDVKSAFVAVPRPAWSLRRRTWRWPLRVGLNGFSEADAEKLTAAIDTDHYILPKLVQVWRSEDEPGSVDVLLVQGPLSDAVTRLVRRRPLANAVIVLDAEIVPDAILESQLSTVRAATAAVASSVLPPRVLSDLVTPLTYGFSHGDPFDVAFTNATDRHVVLWAEPGAMQVASVPELARRTARHLRRATVALGAVFPHVLQGLSFQLETAATGAFHQESGEATQIAQLSGTIEPELSAVAEERWMQAYVGENRDNVFRHGPNPVFVFVGPREEEALGIETPLDEQAFPWEEEEAEAFRLTVLLISSRAEPAVQQAELDLPRFGRSGNVRFNVTVEQTGSDVTARIILLFRNRVLQTAVLSGLVGSVASLVGRASMVPSLAGLDDRRAFDVALVANHTDDGQAMIMHSNGRTHVSEMPSLPPIAEEIANELADAVHLRSTKGGLRTEKVRKLLIELANSGRDLFNEIEKMLGPIAEAERIQIVTASGQWFLPIELLYTRYAPDDDARICETYLANPVACDGECTPQADRKSVCPNAFWGLSKTIERHHFDPAVDGESPNGYLLLGKRQPRPGDRDVMIGRVLVGASSRIKAATCTELVKPFGASGAIAGNWEEWITQLRNVDTQLLVLLPHTDYASRSLEINDDRLRRSRIEAEYVTGNRDVAPVVLLLGCRTTGRADDPAGFATRFITKGARAVFHSSTDLLNVHATELAKRLIVGLTDRGRKPEFISETLAAFRREAVSEGWIAAFAIAAYGDADWRV
jgi:hypothetical protein